MRYFFPVFLLLVNTTFAQVGSTPGNAVKRPKLVVGIVVDQMRWDFLYRYYDRYAADGGFKRLVNKGFSCENTLINYIPTYTACGHATLYTGSVPAIHGITGNGWYDTLLGRSVYCTEDRTVKGVGTQTDAGQMSPKNMQVTTICDELRIATNFRSKVIGISIKDRGSILPAGHAANGAYWYDSGSGDFVTSTWYMDALPKWVSDFNNKKWADTYFKMGWKTLYPVDTYVQSTQLEEYHKGIAADKIKTFPYNYENNIGKNYGALPGSPYGNTIVKEMAFAAINHEELGKDSVTDFLAVSFSTPDYVGHGYGPNSIEVEDIYLRLDKELGELFRFLDTKVGKDQYLVFLSADHGAAHSTNFSVQHKLPGNSSTTNFQQGTDSVLRKKFGNYKFIKTWSSQLFLDHALIDSLKADKNAIVKTIIDYISIQEPVHRVFDNAQLMTVPLPEKVRTRIENGFYPSRTGDIQILMKSGYIGMVGNGTTHGSWNPYDAHIPLVWYGWNVKPGRTAREIYMTDAAATIAAMLRIQMPSGCIGDVIEELVR